MILIKTEHGQRVLKDRSVALSPRLRSAFILFDGKRSVDEVLRATTGLTPEDVASMVEQGLLIAMAGPAPKVPKPVSDRSANQRYQDAYLVATELTSGLGLRGFRLNLALEGIKSYEELVELAPRIREAVGPEKYARLEQALNG